MRLACSWSKQRSRARLALSWTVPYLRAFRFSLVMPQAGFLEAFCCWIWLGGTGVTLV